MFREMLIEKMGEAEVSRREEQVRAAFNALPEEEKESRRAKSRERRKEWEQQRVEHEDFMRRLRDAGRRGPR